MSSRPGLKINMGLAIENVFKQLKHASSLSGREIVDIDFIAGQVREAMQQAVFATLSNYAGNQQSVIGSSREMTPGAATIDYNRNW